MPVKYPRQDLFPKVQAATAKLADHLNDLAIAVIAFCRKDWRISHSQEQLAVFQDLKGIKSLCPSEGTLRNSMWEKPLNTGLDEP
jgi:hypothetical protein